jgi:hypothetical protein
VAIMFAFGSGVMHVGDIYNACVPFYFFRGFSDSYKVRAGRRRITHNGSNDAFSSKDVPFGVLLV